MVGKKQGGESPLFKGLRKMKERIFLTFSLLLLINTGIGAQNWEEYYDVNTEISLKGKIVEIIENKQGLVIIGVLQKDKIYNVLTAPRWFMDQQNINLHLNDEIVVHGAKFFSRRGEFFIFARAIHNISNGMTYTFRESSTMKPKWRGKGKGQWMQP